MEATARLKKQGLKGGGISSQGLGRAFMKGGLSKLTALKEFGKRFFGKNKKGGLMEASNN